MRCVSQLDNTSFRRANDTDTLTPGHAQTQPTSKVHTVKRDGGYGRRRDGSGGPGSPGRMASERTMSEIDTRKPDMKMPKFCARLASSSDLIYGPTLTCVRVSLQLISSVKRAPTCVSSLLIYTRSA